MKTSTHGGARPGAGRPPRPDGRKSRVVKMPLTETEFELIKDIPTDMRRDFLLDGLARFLDD